MLVLNEDQILLQESARKTIAAQDSIATLRRLRAPGHVGCFDREDWASCVAQGWAGVLIPEQHGGFDFGHVGAGLIAHEIGRGLATVPFLSSAVLSATALRVGGSDTQQKLWLPRIAEGAVVAFAVDAAAKHKPTASGVAAQSLGGGRYRLDGRKVFVVDAPDCKAVIVVARAADGIMLFLLERDRAGLCFRNRLLIDGRRASDLVLDGVEADAHDLVGQGSGALTQTLNAGRACVAAELCGMAERAFELTLDYLKVRQQFGRLIGQFQALQHRAATMYCELQNASAAVLAATKALDENPQEAALAVSVAKAKANEVARYIVDEALQLHGGIGMTDELDIGLYMKRARVDAELLGDTLFHENIVASSLGY